MLTRLLSALSRLHVEKLLGGLANFDAHIGFIQQQQHFKLLHGQSWGFSAAVTQCQITCSCEACSWSSTHMNWLRHACSLFNRHSMFMCIPAWSTP